MAINSNDISGPGATDSLSRLSFNESTEKLFKTKEHIFDFDIKRIQLSNVQTPGGPGPTPQISSIFCSQPNCPRSMGCTRRC